MNRLSSHIHVTASQAIVTYSWGDFKHDPIQVLARYFDAFLYLANWGSKRLAFRFPKGLLDPRHIKPYLWEYRIELEPVGDSLILDISLHEEEGFWVEDEGWLSSLSRLRDDLLQGDYPRRRPVCHCSQRLLSRWRRPLPVSRPPSATISCCAWRAVNRTCR